MSLSIISSASSCVPATHKGRRDCFGLAGNSEADGSAIRAGRVVGVRAAVVADSHEAGGSAARSRSQPPVAPQVTALNTLDAVHVVSEERILDFVASRPPRRSHDFGAHDFKLSGKPQLTYVRPLLFVVGGKDVALVIACLRINQLVRDNAFQRIGQVVVNTVRRIVLVHHFKRFGRAVGNLPRQRVDEQIAVACAPWIFQRFRRTVVDGDKIHLERLRPQLTGHEVDVVSEFRCTVARIRVDTRNLRI